jgi:hypothetical protein
VLWDAFGDRTITCIARGTRYLAAIWQAAWDLGKGDANIGEGKEIDQNDIEALYNDPNVVPSIPLDHYPADKNADWSEIERSTPATASGGARAQGGVRTKPASKATGKAKTKPKPKPKPAARQAR